MDITTKQIICSRVPNIRVYERELEYDTALPDYLPDISRPLFVTAHAGQAEIVPEGEKATVRAEISYELTYESDYKGKLRTATFTGIFTQKTDMPESALRLCLIRVAPQSSICKMLNPRRFLVRTHMICELRSRNQQNATVLSAETSGCCILTDSIGLAQYGFGNTTQPVSETFSVGDAGNIADIVSSVCATKEAVCTCSEGYVTVSSAVDFSVVYEREGDGALTTVSRNVPFSCMVDCDFSHEGATAIAFIDTASMTAESGIDAYGDSKNITVSAKLSVAVCSVAEGTQTIVKDIFLPGYNGEPKFEALSYAGNTVTDRIPWTLVHTFAEHTDVSRILLHNVNVRVAETRVEEAQTQIKSIVTATALFEKAGEVQSAELSTVFDFPIPTTNVTEIIPELRSSILTAENGGLELKVEGIYTYRRDDELEVKTVCAFTEGEEITRAHPISVFFAAEGDELWEIAKSHSVDIEKLRDANPACRDGLHTGTRIIIT